MRIGFGAALLVAVAACGGGGDATGTTGTTTKGTVTKIALSANNLTIQIGETSPLTVTARDSAGHTITGRTATWTTADASIATVSSTGVVTSVAQGDAYLRVKVDSISDSVHVQVIPKVGFVIVLPQSTTVLIPNRLQMSVLLQDANHTPIPVTVAGGTTWTVSDITKATISPTGLLSSVAVGSVVVTARFQSGSFPAFTSTTTTFIVQRVGG